MNPILENFYYKLPVFAQHCAVSLNGYQLNRIRKTGKYGQFYNEIVTRTQWNRDQYEKYQLEQLKNLVKTACESVPFYQREYARLGLHTEQIQSVKDIEKLPLLSREEIKKTPAEYISSQVAHQIAIHTTGTTGSPLKILCDREARQLNYAFFDTYLDSIGINPKDRHIVIGGRIVVLPDTIHPPYWRYSYFQKSLLMSSYHLSDKFLKAYVDRIESFKPEYIESYPSSIYAIASYMDRIGRYLECKAVVTSGESLFPEQREVVERVFNTQVFDQYGSAEMCVFVAQCQRGKYHVRPDYGVLEILDDSGIPLPKGHVGNVVCTGFINQVMPLIRYPIGDLAAFLNEEFCECGQNTPIIESIQGRKDDVILTQDGRRIGRMSPVLKGFNIIESQFIQRELGHLDVLLVPRSDFDHSKDINRVVEAVKKRVGGYMAVHVHLVEKLERGRGNKLKSVISYCDHILSGASLRYPHES